MGIQWRLWYTVYVYTAYVYIYIHGYVTNHPCKPMRHVWTPIRVSCFNWNNMMNWLTVSDFGVPPIVSDKCSCKNHIIQNGSWFHMCTFYTIHGISLEWYVVSWASPVHHPRGESNCVVSEFKPVLFSSLKMGFWMNTTYFRNEKKHEITMMSSSLVRNH